MNEKTLTGEDQYEEWDSYWRNREQRSEEELKAYIDWAIASSKFQAVLKTIRSEIGTPSGKSTVELGCGEAMYSLILATYGARPLCVDYSQAALDRARRNFAVMGQSGKFLQKDIRNVPESISGKFDVCLSFGTVEHYIEDARLNMVRLHHGLVRPGGIVVISEILNKVSFIN